MARITVTGVQALSPNLARIDFEGEALVGAEWKPGHKVKLGIAEGVARSYTPSSVDVERGTLSAVFHLHGNGPAARWAAAAKPGDTVELRGPGRSVAAAEGPVDWALFYGDETTLGLASALLDALPSGAQVLGAVELSEADLHAVEALGLGLDALAVRVNRGDALLAHAGALQIPEGEGVVWLSGNAPSVLALRKRLFARGVPKAWMRCKPYWSEWGHDHRKRLEKTELMA